MFTSNALKTNRLALVRFEATDTDAIFELHNDPEVMRFLNDGESTPRNIIVTETMPLLTDFVFDNVFGFWKVVDRKGTFLGWCSLRESNSSIDPMAAKDAELGYRFCRQSWGQGYCSEAMQLLIKNCFETTSVQRLIATTFDENFASIRIMEKLGMTYSRSFKWDASLSPGTTYQAQEVQWSGFDVEYVLERKDWLSFNHSDLNG